MVIPYSTVLILAVFFLILVLAAIILMVIQYYRNKYVEKKMPEMADFILKELPGAEIEKSARIIRNNQEYFIRQYIEYFQENTLTEDIVSKAQEAVEASGIKDRYRRLFRSNCHISRIKACTYLGYFSSDEIREEIESTLKKEKKDTVKLYMINALWHIGNPKSIPIMVDSIIGSSPWYRRKANVVISEFGSEFNDYVPEIHDREEREIQLLLIYFASVYPDERLHRYLLSKVDSPDKEIAVDALEAIKANYPADLNDDRFLQSSDVNKQIAAIQALGKIREKRTIDRLLPLSSDSGLRKHLSASISNILAENPRLLLHAEDVYYLETDTAKKEVLADAISSRIEYFILKLLDVDNARASHIVKSILVSGRTSSVINFLNKNKNIELENNLVSIIRESIGVNKIIEKEFCLYLKEKILKKLDLSKSLPEKTEREEKKEGGKIALLYMIISIMVLIFPVIYLIRYSNVLGSLPVIRQIKQYVIDFNYYLVYYSVTVNSTYLILLFLSFLGVKKQFKLWNIKNITLMFKKNVLPSISIIAPAYNEEASIIESVNSLLNLRYPDYELIVVNDGSPDQTLNRVLEYFNLEKTDVVINEEIPTQAVRGIYRNNDLPKLTVIDKNNGGKADSLNAGINLASKRFFCGIDSDSLLEEDALLKVVAPLMDSEDETVAFGGNIFPINGCKVSKGVLEELRLPENRLGKFQTIEYLRAYMAGRVGWAYINCLLIISGAFGLFSKRRVVEVGGYLTSKGKYGKDTVGEDMELVVRLGRHMREQKKKHRIAYAFNANCWTEVPENLKILYRQRDRWQRGLIDILLFHKKLLFNKNYGRMGIVSLPYFAVFECVGPLFEIQGYMMVLAALFLGLLNAKIALMLFVSTILMGIMISVSAMLISLKQYPYFKLKEMYIMIGYAIIENFGFRQMISLWRVFGYINSMREPKGWGKMERKGFASPQIQ